MRLPPSQIDALKTELALMGLYRPCNDRLIRDAVQLKCIIDKDMQKYDKMEPLLKQSGCNGQEKISLNPLADRIARNLYRHSRILWMLGLGNPSPTEEAPESGNNSILDDLMMEEE